MPIPFLGFGLGLRPTHYQYILDHKPEIDWFEVMTEDFLIAGGKPRYYLHKIRENYPVALHGVSLSIGSCDPLNWKYLGKIKQLAEEIKPAWISDHLCWTGLKGINLHDLLPLPYTQEALTHIVERVKKVQDFLGRQILLENVSSYVQFQSSEMREWEFLQAVADAADCYILLDINNVYVNAFNHHFNTIDFLKGLHPNRVKQFHLAGHEQCDEHIIDTHDHPIVDSVWDLYEKGIKLFPAASVLIERDANIPAFEELWAELKKAKMLRGKYSLKRIEHEALT